MLAIPGSHPPGAPSVCPNRLSCRFIRKTPSLGSPDTIRQPMGRMAPAGALHVKPDQDAASSCTCRHQHTPVEAGSAGQEALEAVDGREAGFRLRIWDLGFRIGVNDAGILIDCESP